MKAVILGTSGYTGQVLLRLLAEHPEITHIYPVSSSSPGKKLLDLDPGLGDSLLGKTSAVDNSLIDISTAVAAKPDIVFAALPHLKSAEICEPFFGSSVVIDLSADFRIRDKERFLLAYGQLPPRSDLLSQAVYGLSEWYGPEISKADLIANPGCYPTTSLLPLIPLLRAGFVSGDIIINASSGISGAGRKVAEAYLYATRTENLNAYSPGRSHRHSHEIEQETQAAQSFQSSQHSQSASNRKSKVYFTPHLAPVKQGMEVTSTFTLSDGADPTAVEGLLSDAYAAKPFVRFTGKRLPQSAQVRGTNRVDFGLHIEDRRIFLMSVSDNLYKGASGQAVQNMNIRFGFPEGLGLPQHGEI